MAFLLSKKQARVILTVTFGNILEWYDIYSYAYFAPAISKIFFNFNAPLHNLLGAFIIFGSGFLARPFGAVVFGRIGDLIGRKRAFILSIVMLTIPTFMMGSLPTYSELGILAPIFLALLRILQTIPAAGEVPGTLCFLYENSEPQNRKFMASWTAVGNQIGAILGLLTTVLMDRLMSEEFLLSWGWRISFWIGGFLGLFGFYLRRKLDETPVYQHLKDRSEIRSEKLINVIKNYRRSFALGTGFGVLNAATYYLIAIYIPSFFDSAIGLSYTENALTSLSILTLTTLILPFFGILGDKTKNNKSIIIYSTLFIIALLPPLYHSINQGNLLFLGIISFLYIIFTTCLTALLSYQVAHLFPPSVRYTGIGLSFNLADGIVGAFTPAAAILLLQYTGNQASFCWLILLCALISLVTYFKIRE